MDKEMIYRIMNGDIDINSDIVEIPAGMQVEDEFAAGKECGRLYNGVYEAKQQLLQRMGVNEDKDIEIILRNMEAISEILAMKMYAYGFNGGMLGAEK